MSAPLDSSASRLRRAPLRSVLYVPASNPRALAKASAVAADAFILDLEDSATPDAKEEARAAAVAAANRGFGARPSTVRVNELDSPWHDADVAAAASSAADAIVIPKISRAEDAARADEALRAAGARQALGLWMMIESPRAILRAEEIADVLSASGRPACLVMGTNDLAKDTLADPSPDRAEMIPWLTTCVAAARAAGIEILDGVFNRFSDDDGFVAECEQGRRLGMSGKTLIHPRQIAPCNRAFSPDEASVSWARDVLDAFASPDAQRRGAIDIGGGRMAERLHVPIAERILAAARRDS